MRRLSGVILAVLACGADPGPARAVLKADPGDRDALQTKAAVLIELGKFEEALAFLRKLDAPAQGLALHQARVAACKACAAQHVRGA